MITSAFRHDRSRRCELHGGFSISVTSASPEEAEKIANTIAELLPNRIADIVEGKPGAR